MEIFNSIDEMCAYYNERTNAYEFYDNGEPLDVQLNFNLRISANLSVGYISALDIYAHDIQARDIYAYNINAHDIYACDIYACNINAHDINFNAVCYAYKIFICNSIHGREENSKYFSLDNEVIIKNKE